MMEEETQGDPFNFVEFRAAVYVSRKPKRVQCGDHDAVVYGSTRTNRSARTKLVLKSELGL